MFLPYVYPLDWKVLVWQENHPPSLPFTGVSANFRVPFSAHLDPEYLSLLQPNPQHKSQPHRRNDNRNPHSPPVLNPPNRVPTNEVNLISYVSATARNTVNYSTALHGPYVYATCSTPYGYDSVQVLASSPHTTALERDIPPQTTSLPD